MSILLPKFTSHTNNNKYLYTYMCICVTAVIPRKKKICCKYFQPIKQRAPLAHTSVTVRHSSAHYTQICEGHDGRSVCS